METEDRNPSLESLALSRIAVGDALYLPLAIVPNVKALRVAVSTYAKKHGIKLTVHVNYPDKEIEIVRFKAAVHEPVGRIGRPNPRSYG